MLLILPAWSLRQGDISAARTQSEWLIRSALFFMAVYFFAIFIKKQYGEIRTDELPFVD
jgi:hypothetical protein